MQNCSIQQESGTGPALSFAGRRTRNVGRCVFLALLLLLPRCADAHLVTTGAGPFYDGIAHFFLSFEEILPIIAISLFAGLRGPRYGRWNAGILALVWIIGGIAGLASAKQQPPSFLSIFPMLLSGVLLASDWKLTAVPVWIISAVMGMVLGFINGASIAGSGSGMLPIIGAAVSVFVVSIFSSALAVTLSSGWTRIALRVAGSWLAALGLLALGWSLKKS